MCSPDGWCWLNPLPQGNSLQSVWGTGPKDVFAVGDHGTVLHYDGQSWKPQPSVPTAAIGVMQRDGQGWSAQAG